MSVDIRTAENCNLPGNTNALVNATCSNGRWERTAATQGLNFFMIVFWSAGAYMRSAYSFTMRRVVNRGSTRRIRQSWPHAKQ